MNKYISAVGISYLSGGKWQVAPAGAEVAIDESQVKDALERGAIEAAKTPPQKKEASK